MLTSLAVLWVCVMGNESMFPKDYNVEEQLPNEVFDWSESLQGTIVGAFYYSYMITMASGGQLADLFGSKRLLMIAVLISSLCTMATPTSAFISPYLVVAVRVLIGFVQVKLCTLLFIYLFIYSFFSGYVV